jgi:hypothetical protein
LDLKFFKVALHELQESEWLRNFQRELKLHWQLSQLRGRGVARLGDVFGLAPLSNNRDPPGSRSPAKFLCRHLQAAERNGVEKVDLQQLQEDSNREEGAIHFHRSRSLLHTIHGAC